MDIITLPSLLETVNIQIPELKSVQTEIAQILQNIENDQEFQSTKNNIISTLNALTLNERDERRLKDAISLMIYLHHDQKNRPDGPYLYHTSGVMREVAEGLKNGNLDIVLAGALHDSVEDQLQKYIKLFGLNENNEIKNLRIQIYSIIENIFGKSVSEIVEGVTNPIEGNTEIQPSDQDIINEYTNHVKESTLYNDKILLCKLCDFSKNGLNLATVADNNRRLWLSRKYLDSYKYFSVELKKGRGYELAKTEFIDEKIKGLEIALKSSQEYITSHE